MELPCQLKRSEVSEKFKTKLLNIFGHYINDFNHKSYGGTFVYDNVIHVFENEWVNRQEKYADELLSGDEFDDRKTIFENIKESVVTNSDEEVLDFVQFILREKGVGPKY